MSVKAVRVDDIDDVRQTPGAFEYYKSGAAYPAGMIYCCPCGCGRTGALRFRGRDPELSERQKSSPSWEWDGNLESPTLSPSVHDMPNGVTHWHGWLRNGVWESC